MQGTDESGEMEAKDTVMSREQIALSWIPLNQIKEPKEMVFIEGQAIATVQAEISFKAGMKEMLLRLQCAFNYETVSYPFALTESDVKWIYDQTTAFVRGRKAGIKEVVDWVNKHLHESPECSYKYCFGRRVWQAFLKENGVEPSTIPRCYKAGAR